jgi:hypothetical protein
MIGGAMIWCGYDRDNGLDFAASRTDIDMSIRAARSLGVSPHEIWAFICDRDLLPPGYEGNVRRAELTAFHEVATRIARTAEPQDGLLLVATNHGTPEGLLTVAGLPDEFAADTEAPCLTPTWLRPRLEAIPGQHVLVMACCRAGIFLDIAARDRCVLTACGRDETYKVDPEPHPPRSPFLYRLLSEWSGASLETEPPPTARALTQACDAIRNQFPGCDCKGTASWPGSLA